MNPDELWAGIDRQRLRTVDLLRQLSEEEWDRPSLCDGWTVRDVAAHLTLQQMTFGVILKAVLRHPAGNINHLIRESSRRQASLPTDQLIAEIEAMVGSRRHNPGVTPLETLIDITVHGQDIALPLGRTLETSPEATAIAADRAWSYHASPKARRKAKVFHSVPFERYSFRATDTEWSAGQGAEIRGPIVPLLLVLTGRTTVLPTLRGSGVSALAADLGRITGEAGSPSG